MYRRWRNWVWACWAVLKRWWRNSGAGGRLQRLTSSCCETSPFRSGSVLRTWSTSTIRKSTHCRLLCHQCLLLSCCPFFFLLLFFNVFNYSRHSKLLPLVGLVCFCPLEGTLCWYGWLTLLTMSLRGCSVSQGHCSGGCSSGIVIVMPHKQCRCLCVVPVERNHRLRIRKHLEVLFFSNAW